MLVLWGARSRDVQAGSREDREARRKSLDLAEWLRLSCALRGGYVPTSIDMSAVNAALDRLAADARRSVSGLKFRSGGRVRVGER